MSKTISFPISTYVDIKTQVTDVVENVPQPLGAITAIKVNPASVITNGNSPDLEAFIRHFRHWKYSGTKVSVVPVARAPVDPAHMTYSASMPSIDPFDIMLFHAWKRWTNRPQTVPITGTDAYFLMDRSWKKCSVLRGFSIFARPMVSGLGYTVPTNPFTLTGGPTGDFDPTKLHGNFQTVTSGNGRLRQTVDIQTNVGYVSAPEELELGCSNTNIDNHRHNLYSVPDDACYSPAGSVVGGIALDNVPSVLDKVKHGVEVLVKGEENVNPFPYTAHAVIKPYDREYCRNKTVTEGWNEVPVDQANLTGAVATPLEEPNRPVGDPSSHNNYGTTTGHFHTVTMSAAQHAGIINEHNHAISEAMQTRLAGFHQHQISGSALGGALSFTYDDTQANTAPWYQADTHAVTVGSRSMAGWQDTRTVDFGASGVSTHLRSPIYPVMLWRVPKHWHTQYTFRVWMKHYFALRSPITHEIYTGNEFANDLCDAYQTELHKPSVCAGSFEAINPADKEWLDALLAHADEVHTVPTEDQFITV